MTSKGFWSKIEEQLKHSIKSFQRKSQPEFIQLIARANLEIGELYETKGDYGSALSYALKSLRAFNQVKDVLGVFNSSNLLSGIYYKQNEIDKAKNFNEKCMGIAEKRKDEYLKAIAIGSHGNIISEEDENQSLEDYKSSLEIFERKNDELNIAATCVNLAGFYANMKNFEKSYGLIKKATEIYKENNAIYDIVYTKFALTRYYYNDSNKSTTVESIIERLNEVLETYEKIGHVRGIARVFNFIGYVYKMDDNFKLASDYFQKELQIHSSLNELSKEKNINSEIALCLTKIGKFSEAKSFFEKNLKAGNVKLEDKISLVELYLIIEDYINAENLSELIINDTNEKTNNKCNLALLYNSIAKVLLHKENGAYNILKKIGKVNYKEFAISWDFSDIESVLDKTGVSKQFFTDAIEHIKGKINYPIIRLEKVKIISEDVGKQAELFYPFTGSVTITKDDEDLKQIMKKLTNSTEVDFDNLEILRIERNKALLVLGFLFKKGFLECKNIDKQMFNLKLTEIGLKILRLNKNRVESY